MKYLILILIAFQCTLLAEGGKEETKHLDILEALKIALEHTPEGKEVDSIKKIEVNDLTYFYFASYGQQIIPYESSELQQDGTRKKVTRYREAKVGILVSQTGEVKIDTHPPRSQTPRRRVVL